MTQRFLFIHQNFPGQFRHVAVALASQGDEVVALGIHTRDLPGVRCLRYPLPKAPRASEIPALRDVESKVFRGQACAAAMARLRDEGFVPDVIVAHPGWGEALFCQDVFPAARVLVFAEFYYGSRGSDFGFDPEFPNVGDAALQRLRLKNTALLHAYTAADGGYAPTRWQRQQLPAALQPKFDVVFDGIDTDTVRPDATAWLQLQRAGVRVGAGDEVITFVNRNLEPYRGFHVFMRALPAILAQRPQARVLIVGADDVSYGSKPAGGGNWRQTMLAEVGAQLPMDRVHFLGNLPYRDYLRVLQVSACHVYFTYPFVLSWSCVEALSAGCLVVGSRTPPVEEFISHGDNGLLVDFFDTADLVRTVTQALADPRQHTGLRQHARDSVLQQYDLRRQCLPRLLALLRGPDARAAPPAAQGSRPTQPPCGRP